MAAVLTTEELRGFLGVDVEFDPEIERLRAFAVEQICRATKIDWLARQDVETFNEAMRVSVWMSYYAVRDEAKNTVFLQERLTALICTLQLCGEESHDF